jgi:uncharacterized protein YndB with AHSA1/START domain
MSETLTQEALTQDTITMERVFPHSPEKVWRALTETDLIILWLMSNDFRPVVGHSFTFRVSTPCPSSGKWDGIVHGRVLECAPLRRLSYSWKTSRSRFNDGPVSGLDTVVTWSLERTKGGTLLRLVHEGFRSENASAFDILRGGWAEKITDLGSVVSVLA